MATLPMLYPALYGTQVHMSRTHMNATFIIEREREQFSHIFVMSLSKDWSTVEAGVQRSMVTYALTRFQKNTGTRWEM